MKRFELKVLDQHWISKNPNDKTDLCSHGQIELRIGDQLISDENDDDWTISTSGLMLLRTLNLDHAGDGMKPIILHCGMLSMLGCPICIDWSIEHKNDLVIIKNAKKIPSVNEKEVIHFPIGEVKIERVQYIREIIRFCDEIKGFFKDKPRDFSEEYEKNEWINFWSEFDRLLGKNRDELKSKKNT